MRPGLELNYGSAFEQYYSFIDWSVARGKVQVDLIKRTVVIGDLECPKTLFARKLSHDLVSEHRLWFYDHGMEVLYSTIASKYQIGAYFELCQPRRDSRCGPVVFTSRIVRADDAHQAGKFEHVHLDRFGETDARWTPRVRVRFLSGAPFFCQTRSCDR
jgi:hypothetical protein